MTIQPSLHGSQLLDAARLALQSVADAAALTTLLYDRWYAPAEGRPAPGLGPVEVAAHLRAADSAGGRLEPGWSVLAAEDALARLGPAQSPWQLPVARGSNVRWVDPIDFLFPDGIGLRPPAGASMSVSARRDSVTLLPGWWTTMSPAWSQASPPLVRLYWSVNPARMCQLVEALTASLDFERPYCLKCPLDLDRCRRADGVVMFVPAADWTAIAPSIHAAYRQVQAFLRPRVPALTRELAPGLALAEDPGDESFGMSRCRVVATGLCRGQYEGIRDVAALRSEAEAELAKHGIRTEAPWLNPGSAAAYPFEARSSG